MRHIKLKDLIKEVVDEVVELNPEKQEQMTTTQLTGLHEKSEKMLQIMQSENVKLEPWMIDLISQDYHNVDAVANKLMFGDKKD